MSGASGRPSGRPRAVSAHRQRRLAPVILVSGLCGAAWMAFAGVEGVPPSPRQTVAAMAAFTAVLVGYVARTSLRGVEPLEQARTVAALGLAALGLFFGAPVAGAFGTSVAAVAGLVILAGSLAWAAYEAGDR